MVRSVAMDQDGVQDASITQRLDVFSLALIVGYATNKQHAKNLGDNFVRMVKTFSADDSPSKAIGEGKYDYIVGVYKPNEETIVIGKKQKASKSIAWKSLWTWP